jgi:hypothetical protein
VTGKDVLVIVVIVVFALVFVRHVGVCVSCICDRRISRLTFRGRENVAGIIARRGAEYASVHPPRVKHAYVLQRSGSGT